MAEANQDVEMECNLPRKTSKSGSISKGLEEVVIDESKNEPVVAKERGPMWQGKLPDPTPLVEEEYLNYDNPQPGNSYFVTTRTAASRIFKFPYLVKKHFPGEAFKHKAKARIPMIAHRAKDPGFDQFGPKPDMKTVAAREALMAQILHQMNESGMIPSTDNENKFIQMNNQMNKRAILPFEMLTASPMMVNKMKANYEDLVNKGDHILIPQPVNILNFRSFWGFIPYVRENMPFISAKREQTRVYEARQSNLNPAVVTCAFMHTEAEYNKATRGRLPISAYCINFDKEPIVPLMGKLSHQTICEWTEINTPNVWREIKNIDETSEL